MTEPAALRNRLLIATSMWREETGEPLPKLPPGDPAEQIQQFELELVNNSLGIHVVNKKIGKTSLTTRNAP